jgi:NAD(P)-dependent dehydrogenase (short-subunit alcohol dehydrogenase family)
MPTAAGLPNTRIRFDGRVVLVTGAGRGLGAAYVRAFAGRGAAVVVHDAGVAEDGTGGNPAIAEGLADEIVRAGGTASACTENLETEAACEAAVAFALDRFGRLDALVNNAGLLRFEDVGRTETATWDRLRRVNLDAPFFLSRAGFRQMRKQGYGRIVFTTSGRALTLEHGRPGLAAYNAGKAGQIGLMVALAVEGQPCGVLANAVSPTAATRMLQRSVDPGELEPEQVAPAVLLLASERCPATGVVLQAAGGEFGVACWAAGEGIDLGPKPEPEGLEQRWTEIADADHQRLA